MPVFRTGVSPRYFMLRFGFEERISYIEILLMNPLPDFIPVLLKRFDYPTPGVFNLFFVPLPESKKLYPVTAVVHNAYKIAIRLTYLEHIWKVSQAPEMWLIEKHTVNAVHFLRRFITSSQSPRWS